MSAADNLDDLRQMAIERQFEVSLGLRPKQGAHQDLDDLAFEIIPPFSPVSCNVDGAFFRRPGSVEPIEIIPVGNKKRVAGKFGGFILQDAIVEDEDLGPIEKSVVGYYVLTSDNPFVGWFCPVTSSNVVDVLPLIADDPFCEEIGHHFQNSDDPLTALNHTVKTVAKIRSIQQAGLVDTYIKSTMHPSYFYHSIAAGTIIYYTGGGIGYVEHVCPSVFFPITDDSSFAIVSTEEYQELSISPYVGESTYYLPVRSIQGYVQTRP